MDSKNILKKSLKSNTAALWQKNQSAKIYPQGICVDLWLKNPVYPVHPVKKPFSFSLVSGLLLPSLLILSSTFAPIAPTSYSLRIVLSHFVVILWHIFPYPEFNCL